MATLASYWTPTWPVIRAVAGSQFLFFFVELELACNCGNGRFLDARPKGPRMAGYLNMASLRALAAYMGWFKPMHRHPRHTHLVDPADAVLLEVGDVAAQGANAQPGDLVAPKALREERVGGDGWDSVFLWR